MSRYANSPAPRRKSRRLSCLCSTERPHDEQTSLRRGHFVSSGARLNAGGRKARFAESELRHDERAPPRSDGRRELARVRGRAAQQRVSARVFIPALAKLSLQKFGALPRVARSVRTFGKM
jgi:hypothetical protein